MLFINITQYLNIELDCNKDTYQKLLATESIIN